MVYIAVEWTRRLKQRNRVPRQLSQSSLSLRPHHISPLLCKQPFCSFILITFAPTFCPPNFRHPSRLTLKDTSLMISLMIPQAELKISFSAHLQHNTRASVCCCLIMFACENHICLSLSPEDSYRILPSTRWWLRLSCCYIELYSNLDFHILQVAGES